MQEGEPRVGYVWSEKCISSGAAIRVHKGRVRKHRSRFDLCSRSSLQEALVHSLIEAYGLLPHMEYVNKLIAAVLTFESAHRRLTDP